MDVDAGILVEPDATAPDLVDAADLVGFEVEVEVDAVAGFDDSMLNAFSLIRSAYEPRALNTEVVVVFCSVAGVVGIIVGEDDDGMMSA